MGTDATGAIGEESLSVLADARAAWNCALYGAHDSSSRDTSKLHTMLCHTHRAASCSRLRLNSSSSVSVD